MAKDYFQDITPSEDPTPQPRPLKPLRKPVPSAPPPMQKDEVEEDPDDVSVPVSPQRSIRNIEPSRTRMRMSGPPARPGDGIPSAGGRGFRGIALWALAALGIIGILVLGLFAFRSSSVIVTPRAQAVTFDDATRFTAFPESVAATSTLPYKMITLELEDSEPVAAQGTQHAETKSSGTVTVYNNYQTSPVRLIKNTRFESADGKVFRTPTEISVPGKKGNTPGSINVTVIADQPGAEYNIAASKFTLPGLKSNDAMYAGVYAQSSSAFSGGFVGDQPAVAPATLAGAISTVRGRLQTKAAEAVAAQEGYRTFSNLILVSYQTLPSTTEAGGGVRIHEKAIIKAVAFPEEVFAQNVAKAVTADAQDSSITLREGKDFTAQTTSVATDWGSKPIDFRLGGSAELVWNVDGAALAAALAGKDESAFQTVITGFPGIQEAHARIQPFWKSSFPSDAAKIEVSIAEPKAAQ